MKRVMHIAQASGGVERYLYTLLKKMNKAEYENILVFSQDYDINKFEQFTNKIECVDMYREIKLLKELRAIIHIRKLIEKYHPDIVYMHSSKAGAIGRIANIGLKNISIYNAHGWAFNIKCKKIKSNIYAYIEKILACLCTKIVAISNFEKESALEYCICKEDKIKVIFNGIDFDEYHIRKGVCKSALKIPENAFIVGSVGRLDKQKAPEIFVKAARLIKDKIPNAFFIMVGDGTQHKQVDNLIVKYGLRKSFLITGWVKNPLDYIVIFDIAMLMSRWEGFGLVLPEYMLEGKPVVATNADAIPNVIINGKNGILVEIDDYHAAAQAVVKIHDNKDLADELTRNGTSSVEQFNAERMAREHEELFKNLLMRKREV